MNGFLTSGVVILADLVDPTDDGSLTALANWVIGGLMVLVVIAGSWHGFKDWNGSKGTAAVTILRDHAVGILAIEAFLGSIIYVANEGFSLPSFLS
jgi:hypothetical protein